MAETLAGWLASLSEVAIARLSSHVLGEASPASDVRTRLAARLRDTAWIDATGAALDESARHALTLVVHASIPVRRCDLADLVRSPDQDPVARLEETGLLACVDDDLADLPPGLRTLLRDRFPASTPDIPLDVGELERGHRRRLFELAGLVAAIANHAPRTTQLGRLHATDAARIVARLSAFGWTTGELERRLSALVELGAIGLGPAGGWWTVAAAVTDPERLFLEGALTELAAPSVPDAVLSLVSRLRGSGPMTASQAKTLLERRLLHQRAAALEPERRGARSEVKGQLARLLTLSAVVVSGEGLEAVLALDPWVEAALEGASPPLCEHRRGFVTPSLEVVAEPSADVSLLARIGLFAELVSVDRAMTFRMTPASLGRGRRLGQTTATMTDALARLSELPVAVTVQRALEAGEKQAASPVLPLHERPDLTELTDAALRALKGESGEEQ